MKGQYRCMDTVPFKWWTWESKPNGIPANNDPYWLLKKPIYIFRSSLDVPFRQSLCHDVMIFGKLIG
ncbi:hypothetical protein GDO81_000295 [Engystomops pustulosus]|uniref:Uncharacterized protein n=1 Tax=Engystomops pustulosus TaxID=76066 RepID=A0AAV7D2W5_ENGPU|nr:hypothetical protein GDO81_000295 [Engystomops pustulosus]